MTSLKIAIGEIGRDCARQKDRVRRLGPAGARDRGHCDAADQADQQHYAQVAAPATPERRSEPVPADAQNLTHVSKYPPRTHRRARALAEFCLRLGWIVEVVVAHGAFVLAPRAPHEAAPLPGGTMRLGCVIEYGPGLVALSYGIFLPPFAEFAEPKALVALAQSAEVAGWDGFFLWDHVLEGSGLAVADSFVMTAAIAQATDRVRLGMLVTPLARRRPWVIARQTATLDVLSEGRLVVGVGLGTRQPRRAQLVHRRGARSVGCAPRCSTSRSSFSSTSGRARRSHSKASTSGCTVRRSSPGRCSGRCRSGSPAAGRTGALWPGLPASRVAFRCSTREDPRFLARPSSNRSRRVRAELTTVAPTGRSTSSAGGTPRLVPLTDTQRPSRRAGRRRHDLVARVVRTRPPASRYRPGRGWRPAPMRARGRSARDGRP